jgi:hypothetical protein
MKVTQQEKVVIPRKVKSELGWPHIADKSKQLGQKNVQLQRIRLPTKRKTGCNIQEDGEG